MLKISRKDLEAEINKITGKKRAKLIWCISEEEEIPEEADWGTSEWTEQYDNQIQILPFESFDEIFYEGKVLFTHGGYWSNAAFVKKTNPTWRDFIKVAEKFASGDHVYLEGVWKTESSVPGVQGFELGYGS